MWLKVEAKLRTKTPQLFHPSKAYPRLRSVNIEKQASNFFLGDKMKFVWFGISYLISRYMRPEGPWQRRAADPRTNPWEQLTTFPPVYPFPTPGPACAVIVGVSQRLLLPITASKQTKERQKKRKTTTVTPRTKDER